MTADSRPFVAGNWKMNKTVEETEAFLAEFIPLMSEIPEDVELAIFPPFTALRQAVELTWDTRLEIGAQNMNAADSGALTGEISPLMLMEAGVKSVILGHSERRQYFNERDSDLKEKVPVALSMGFTPILCVGETEAERKGNETEEKLRRQVGEGLASVPSDLLHKVVIAYEPIWAIGTGLVATTEQVAEAIAFIRRLASGADAESGSGVRVLYGGSVNGKNARDLFAQGGIDGALVGGASLEPQPFAEIARAAGR